MGKFFKKRRLEPFKEELQEKRAARVADIILKGQRRWADFMGRQFGRLGPGMQKMAFAVFILVASIYFAAVTINAIQGGTIPLSMDRIERPDIVPLKSKQRMPAELDSVTVPPVVP